MHPMQGCGFDLCIPYIFFGIFVVSWYGPILLEGSEPRVAVMMMLVTFYDPHKGRSQSGYVFTYGNVVSWRSMK